MTIDWLVVAFELVNFGVLVAILVRFVFRPVAATLAQRRAEAEARELDTRARELAVADQREQLERELGSLATLAEQRATAAMAEAQAQAEQIVARAREQARARLSEAEAESGHQRRRAIEQFRGEVMGLATAAARRLVADLGAPELGLAFVRRGLHALTDRPDSAAIQSLRVQISSELDPAEVTALVHHELPGVTVEIVTDDSLVAGARMLADGHEVRASAGASLEAWYLHLTAEPGAASA